ncbi:GNAT family N-acetyltransferase [Candidatus Daviesbacteria bacterium]|nr:GNAT family N-acetyltransferase [Candidatus Daviesbacteria bacterium]
MLRKAKIEDLDSIYKLISDAAKKGKVLKRPKSEIKQVLSSFYVWVEDKEVAGCVSLEIYNKKLSEVRSLVVLPKYQGMGIGSKLIQACVNEAKAKEIYEVLAVTDKISLFEKMGFSKQLKGQWPLFLRLNP